jgi:hypothetical protein
LSALALLATIENEEERCSLIGSTIAHYRIETKLGEGGMEDLYPADDTTLERKGT